MPRHRWAQYRPADHYGLGLPLFALFLGVMLACRQGSVGTRSVQTTSQSPPAKEQSSSTDKIFTVVEEPPNFPGGAARLGDYLRQNLRYPEAARKAQVQGRVFVAFIVTNDGNIKDAQILKGLGFGTNEEALRLIQSMPRWTPGKQAGQPVAVRYNVVVPFQLN